MCYVGLLCFAAITNGRRRLQAASVPCRAVSCGPHSGRAVLARAPYAHVLVRVLLAHVRGAPRIIRPAGSGAMRIAWSSVRCTLATRFPRRRDACNLRAARARHARRVRCTRGACRARDPSFQIRMRFSTSSVPTVMSRHCGSSGSSVVPRPSCGGKRQVRAVLRTSASRTLCGTHQGGQRSTSASSGGHTNAGCSRPNHTGSACAGSRRSAHSKTTIVPDGRFEQRGSLRHQHHQRDG